MSEIGNAEIIKILSLMGQFLDIKDANRFRVRAYERAVQILAGVTQKLSEMSAEELKTIPGIGSSMIAHIREIAENGTLGEFEKLKRQIPSGVLKLLEIQGMGPKRAKLLWETLKIDSLEHLKKAAQEGKLRELPGFGEKLEAKILKGIAFAQAAANRALLWDAKGAADELVKTVKSLPQVIQAVAAGSLRRGKETIGDLDILCTATDGAQVIERFTKLPQIERVLAAGETKAAVWLNSQIQCDLRVVAPDSFGAALLYFTGSKDHNITLREYALKLGYSINEYGLFKIKPGSETKELGKKIAGKTEEEIFKALGLDWIAPELRENRGEIEAARAGRLPKLIEYRGIFTPTRAFPTAPIPSKKWPTPDLGWAGNGFL
ncbi:MAG: hypothetical protein HY747_02930 [Elusimicrobia bacterium]|nr:hypothetical protein [Elusimicrobiota bacterium]